MWLVGRPPQRPGRASTQSPPPIWAGSRPRSRDALERRLRGVIRWKLSSDGPPAPSSPSRRRRAGEYRILTWRAGGRRSVDVSGQIEDYLYDRRLPTFEALMKDIYASIARTLTQTQELLDDHRHCEECGESLPRGERHAHGGGG